MLSLSGNKRDRQAQQSFVYEVGPDDVQLGRGRPVITSVGNQRFRALVLENKPEYSASNRHAQKDLIARRILSTIRERGGRFLRKIDSAAQRKRLGIEDDEDAWEITDDETSLNKVKQALREHDGAPEIKQVAATTAKVQSPSKRKKENVLATADADVLTNLSDSSKSTGQKRKKESRITTSVSLAESIRLNASKLGTDLSMETSISGKQHVETTSIRNQSEEPFSTFSQRALHRSQFQAIRETADRLNQAASELGIGKGLSPELTEVDPSIGSFSRSQMHDLETLSSTRRSVEMPSLPQVTMPTTTANILLRSSGFDDSIFDDSVTGLASSSVTGIERELSANEEISDDDRKPEAEKPTKVHRK